MDFGPDSLGMRYRAPLGKGPLLCSFGGVRTLPHIMAGHVRSTIAQAALPKLYVPAPRTHVRSLPFGALFGGCRLLLYILPGHSSKPSDLTNPPQALLKPQTLAAYPKFLLRPTPTQPAAQATAATVVNHQRQ